MKCAYLTVIVALAWWAVAPASGQSGVPKIRLSVGEPQSGSISWNTLPASGPVNPNTNTNLREIALRGELAPAPSPNPSGISHSLDNAWMVVVGTAYLAPRPGMESHANSLLGTYPWLAKPVLNQQTPTFSALRTHKWATGGYPFSNALGRIEPGHLDALGDTALLVDDRLFLQLLELVTDPVSDDSVKRWAQPFLHGNPAPQPLAWDTAPPHWSNPALGSVAPYVWMSTHSRTVGGVDLLSVNKLVESSIRFQARNGSQQLDPSVGNAFLASQNYRVALEIGLELAVQVITVRNPTAVAGNALLGNLLTNLPAFPGLGEPNPFLGLSVTAPIILTPSLPDPDTNPLLAIGDNIEYAVEVGSHTSVAPGGLLLLAVGQSAEVTHARFQVGDAGYVNVPLLAPPVINPLPSGLVATLAPLNMVPGSPIDLILVGTTARPGVNPTQVLTYQP